MCTIQPLLRSLTFLALSLAMCPAVLDAQTPRSESLTIADGLSQGMIYEILQTQDGFLWFATKDGLNRYDGYHFEIYTNDPFNPFSIAGNEVNRLLEDSQGNLWMSIVGRGLDMLERNTGKFLHLTEYNGISLKSSINKVVEAPDGSIWAATNDGIMEVRLNAQKIDTKTPDLRNSAKINFYTKKTPQGNEAFTTIAPISNEVFAVASLNEQTYLFNPAENQFKPILQGKPDLFVNKATKQVWAIMQGRMFAIKKDGAHEIKGLTHIPLLIFQSGSNDLLWAGTDGKTTNIYTMPEAEIITTGSVAKAKLLFRQDKQTPSAGIDRGRNLWVGSGGYGLQKVKLNQQPFQHFMKGNSVRWIFGGDGIYIRFNPSHIDKLDEATDRTHIENWLPPSVSQIYQTKDNVTYVVGGDPNNNWLLTRKNGVVEKQIINIYSEATTPLVERPNGDIWIGGAGALVLGVQNSTKKQGYLDFSNELGNTAVITAMHLDGEKNLWIGSTNGMVSIQPDEIGTADFWNQSAPQNPNKLAKVFQNDAKNPSSLRYNYVTSICDDPAQPERYLWVGTKGGGLGKLDKSTGKFQHFTSQNSGLPNDVVYGILPDEQGNLWMSTNRGLSRLTAKGLVFQNFRESDGLQSDEFNTGAFAKTLDGRLLFGGVNGLTVFRPSEIHDRKSSAPVCLTGLKINNLPVDYSKKDSPIKGPINRTKQITLDHTQNLVTLEFALMDFSTPQENRYRYRLHGVDPNWVEAGTNHVANYAQLRPGSYLFEVVGSIGGNEWSKPASIRITILPPWWATWWAYAAYALLALGAAFGVFYFFKKRLLLQNALKLEHEEATRLKELDSFKSRLFTNLTHEFRTPLTVILGMTQQLGAGEKDMTKIASGLKLIENNGKSLLRLINQLLDLSKLENNAFQLNLQLGDIVPYLRYVTESFQTYANSKNLSLRFFTTLEKLEMDFDPEQVKQVLTNLISNGVKFTPEGGEVKVNLGMRDEGRGTSTTAGSSLIPHSSSLVIAVSDTGIGIGEKDLPHVFDRFFQVDSTTTRAGEGTGIGLAHTQELVKIMGGSIAVESQLGKGTSFKVTLPITQVAPKNDRAETIEPFLTAQVIGSVLTEEKKASLNDAPTILIVEDNPDVVHYLRSCLEDIYQLEVAYNGKIGIEKALELIPDLIISDVMMPEKDGYQVCDALKNDVRTSHIPIILLTAKADAASKMAGLRRGADAYLSKPFDLEELLVRVSVSLDNQRRIASYFSQNLPIGKTANMADPALSEAVQVEDAFVKKVNEIIEANYTDEDFALPQLCQKIGMSRSQLFRKMKAVMDTAPSDLIRSFRLNKAKTLLENEGLTVAEAAYRVGFKDPSYFSKLFQEEFGFQPSATHK